MFEVDEMEGCHSCLYEDMFDTDKEPCKYCYGLSLYTKKETKMKDNETLAIISNDEDEWYCHYQTCSVCGTDFMCSNAKFCPGCGRKIIGSKRGNETVFYGKGDENEQ